MTDLHVTDDRPTTAEQQAVDAVVAPADAALIVEGERLVRGGRARRLARRHLLLPVLRARQREIGWISPGALNHVAIQLQVPPAEAYGVATFYDLLRTEDPGHDESVTHVCLDAACQIKDSDGLAQQLAAQGRRVHRAPCLGQCERAPAVFVQGRGEPDHVPADAAEAFSLPQQDRRGLRLLRRVGLVDPTSLESYRAHGGYEALERSVELGAEAVIDAVSAAGLVGRGGAAFPTGTKWRGVASQQGRPKHIVANCDESEPGTFKDRIVMEHDPFAVIEAMTIAGLATGAEHGWVYIRGEYPRSAERIRHAVAAARDAGLLGSDVAGSGQRVDIEVRRGAGAYICGEETALVNSSEGYRGEPRN